MSSCSVHVFFCLWLCRCCPWKPTDYYNSHCWRLVEHSHWLTHPKIERYSLCGCVGRNRFDLVGPWWNGLESLWTSKKGLGCVMSCESSLVIWADGSLAGDVIRSRFQCCATDLQITRDTWVSSSRVISVLTELRVNVCVGRRRERVWPHATKTGGCYFTVRYLFTGVVLRSTERRNQKVFHSISRLWSLLLIEWLSEESVRAKADTVDGPTKWDPILGPFLVHRRK